MEYSKIQSDFQKAVAAANNTEELKTLRHRFLGRRGRLNELRKSIDFQTLPEEKRRQTGRSFNELRSFIETELLDRAKALEPMNDGSNHPQSKIDVTLPAESDHIGSLHPVTLVQLELEDIFAGMGFMVLQGYEIESEYYNFDALNVPSDHPARDMQDTFWLKNGEVLRTHTSANQVRTMELYPPPFRAVFPGRCFRYEAIDAGHENTFCQMEGLFVDQNVSISHLIGVMRSLLNEIFGGDVRVRLRPGYFPYVEPGFELDIECLICGGAGCSTCKRSGWVELMPCGLVHPLVIKSGNLDPEKWRGFAFGLGLTRLAMMKFGIPEIRLLNSCDIRFADQFPAII